MNGISDARSQGTGACSAAYSLGLSDSHDVPEGAEYTCAHHVHYDGAGAAHGDGTVIYDNVSPGGCYTKGLGHTHDMTGKCPECVHWYYPIITKISDIIVTGPWFEDRDWDADVYVVAAECEGCGQTWRYENYPQDFKWDYDTWGFPPNRKHECRIQASYQVQEHEKDCGEPCNTWGEGCGKNSSTLEGRRFLFTEPLQDYKAMVQSQGTVDFEGGVRLDSSDLYRMANELNQISCAFRKAAVDKFIEGCRGRSDGGCISRVEYITHIHGNECYGNGGALVCAEAEGLSVDGLEIWY